MAKLQAIDAQTVEKLADIRYQRKIVGAYKHPEVVERVLRRYITPSIGKLPVDGVRPNHIDLVLTKIVDAGAPTVVNDALRYLVRMFHFAVKRRLIETNPAYGFDISDAGGAEALYLDAERPFQRSASMTDLISVIQWPAMLVTLAASWLVGQASEAVADPRRDPNGRTSAHMSRNHERKRAMEHVHERRLGSSAA